MTEATLAAGTVIGKDNGAMDFIANATGAIFSEGWTPELQQMVGGRQDAAGMLKAVQAEYEKELVALDCARSRHLESMTEKPTTDSTRRARGSSPPGGAAARWWRGRSSPRP